MTFCADLRGHGLTATLDDDGPDFSRGTMAGDIVALWRAMFGAGTGDASTASVVAGAASSERDSMPAGAAASEAAGAAPAEATGAGSQAAGSSSPHAPAASASGGAAGAGSTSQTPPTVLVGHSMGGALAVWAASKDVGGGIPGVEGVCVIDVVEGTALGEAHPA